MNASTGRGGSITIGGMIGRGGGGAKASGGVRTGFGSIITGGTKGFGTNAGANAGEMSNDLTM